MRDRVDDWQGSQARGSSRTRTTWYTGDRADQRRKVLTVFLANGGQVRVPGVTAVTTEHDAGPLTVRCRNGAGEIAAFNPSHIVGWLLEAEPDRGTGGWGGDRSASAESEAARVNAIREAIGGLGPLVADDEERYSPGEPPAR